MRKGYDRFTEAEQLWEEGEFKRAMAVYKDILSDDGISTMARAIVCEYVGRLHIGIGDIETAEEFLRRSIEMDPEGVDHHVQLANCLCLASRNEEAWKIVSKLYRHQPEHPAVIHYMGKMLDERGQHKKGLALMKKAVSMEPDNERFLADLSFTYMMHGNAGAAIVCSEQAMALNPDDDVVQFIHGVAMEFEKQEQEKTEDRQISHNPGTVVRTRRRKPAAA